MPVTKITFPHADEDSFSFNSHIIFQINKALDYAIADIVDFYFFFLLISLFMYFFLVNTLSFSGSSSALKIHSFIQSLLYIDAVC